MDTVTETEMAARELRPRFHAGTAGETWRLRVGMGSFFYEDICLGNSTTWRVLLLRVAPTVLVVGVLRYAAMEAFYGGTEGWKVKEKLRICFLSDAMCLADVINAQLAPDTRREGDYHRRLCRDSENP